MKVLIVDDHPLFRAGLVQTVQMLFEQAWVLEAHSVEEGLLLCDANPDMDLLLLDINLPEINGLDGLTEFRRQHPACPVMIVTGNASADMVSEGRARGAQGFVGKDLHATQMQRAIQTVLDGDLYFPADVGTPQLPRLSVRQMDVLTRLAEGKPNKQIARDLGIGDHTVRAHLTRIFQILGAKTRTEVVVVARRQGLL
jgi:DNA-binding NarL/FixJ family response regulator